MDRSRFRPEVTSLEDRTVPALTPAEVFAAIDQSNAAQAELQHLVERKVENLNIFTVTNLRASLPTLTVDSLRSAAVLGEYQNVLIQQSAGNASLTPYIGLVAQERYKAEVNALYAFALTQQVKGIPINTVAAPTPADQPISNPYLSRVPLPPVPPPRPPAPTTPETPPIATDFTTSNGLSTTVPPSESVNYVTQTSGLRIWNVVEGVGAPVTNGQTTNVFYAGFLAANGNLFDSSYVGKTPPATAELKTSEVIAGFREGLIGLKPGGVRRIYIPAALGYGALPRGTPDTPGFIPANSDLIFEIKLVSSSTPTAQTTGN